MLGGAIPLACLLFRCQGRIAAHVKSGAEVQDISRYPRVCNACAISVQIPPDTTFLRNSCPAKSFVTVLTLIRVQRARSVHLQAEAPPRSLCM